MQLLSLLNVKYRVVIFRFLANSTDVIGYRNYGLMDGLMDGWMDGWMDGLMDGWIDEWMDGRTD